MGKKKKKKGRRGTDVPANKMNFEEMVRLGRAHIEAERSRDAIDLLKKALKKGNDETGEIPKLLFEAYIQREKQLRSKGMAKEAQIVKKQAMEVLPDVTLLSEAQLVDFIEVGEVSDAVGIYGRYQKQMGRSDSAEVCLAGRVVETAAWDALSGLDATSPLRQDAETVKAIAPLMDQGDWEGALEGLRSVRKNSPYAPFRLLCRAMTDFYGDDHTSARRALSMIPDAFPLKPVSRQLENAISNGGGVAHERLAPEMQTAFLEGPVGIGPLVEKLAKASGRMSWREIADGIADLAQHILPENIYGARYFLVQSAIPMVLLDDFDEGDFKRMAETLLSKEAAGLLLAKAKLLSPHTPPSYAGHYIVTYLEKEFPDENERRMAHAHILASRVELLVRRDEIRMLKMDAPRLKNYASVLGLSSFGDGEVMAIEMLLKALRLDPEMRSGYEMLAKLPRTSRAARNKAEEAFLMMAEKFPDDPFPCLELAEIYYQHNAFRKAETVLKQAMERAPHDARVVDRHTVSLLVSADKNITREKFHLVERDLAKAESLNSRKSMPFVREKQLLYALKKHSGETVAAGQQKQLWGEPAEGEPLDVGRLIGEKLVEQPPIVRFRILAALHIDIRRQKLPEKEALLKLIENEIRSLQPKAGLEASDVMALLSPLEKHYFSLFGTRRLAPTLLACSDKFFDAIPDKDVVDFFDAVMERDLLDRILVEVRKRLKKRKRKIDPRLRQILTFYKVILEHILGAERSARMFYETIDPVANTPVFPELQRISRRMSRFAEGVLKECLERFNFAPLDLPESLLDMLSSGKVPAEMVAEILGIDPDDDDDFKDDDDDEGFVRIIYDLMSMTASKAFETGANHQLMIDTLESLIDEADIRDAPTFVIREFRNFLERYEPTLVEALKRLADCFAEKGLRPSISWEAEMFLFGKSRKKRPFGF